MRYLVLCVDRDNDLGAKADILSPVVGRKENIEAAVSLAVVDPEDSDVNCIFGAVRVLDELAAEGEEVEIATICGDEKIGRLSDQRVARELDAVIEDVKPDRVVVVSDGAEDEFIIPLIASRVRIDRMVRVVVKQEATIEHYYYVLTRLAHDKKIQRRFIFPAGLLIFVWLFFTIVGSYIGVGSLGWIAIAVGLGSYMVILGLDLQEQFILLGREIRKSVTEGAFLTGLIVIISLLLFIGMVSTALAMISQNPTTVWDATELIVSNFYLWLFSAMGLYFVGKAVDDYWRKGVFHTSTIFALFSVLGMSIMVYAILEISRLSGTGAQTFNKEVVTFFVGAALPFMGYAIYRYVKRTKPEKYTRTMWAR